MENEANEILQLSPLWEHLPDEWREDAVKYLADLLRQVDAENH